MDFTTAAAAGGSVSATYKAMLGVDDESNKNSNKKKREDSTERSRSGSSATTEKDDFPESLTVVFMGNRDETVPALLAMAANQPCKSVPEKWSDEHGVACLIPAPGDGSSAPPPPSSSPPSSPLQNSKQKKSFQEQNQKRMIPTTLYYGDAQTVAEKRPQVAVLCYSPVAGLSAVKNSLDDLSLEVRSAQVSPKPCICLCAVQVEKLHGHTDINVTPVTPSESCDLFVRTRAATYAEISSELAVNVSLLSESIGHAALLQAEKRPTPELIKSLRDHVVAAAFAGATWVARRDRRTKKIFYFNRLKNKAQWERPHDFDGIEPLLTEEEKRQQEAMMVEANERRGRLERERRMNEEYLADVQVYEERMRNLEKKFEEINASSNENEKQVHSLRRQMSENAELLRKLQLQYESRVKNKSSFVNNEAEKDSMLEKQLQTQRERLFDLEASIALREEKEDDVHLSELSVENKKLAADVRLCLKRQLETQKQFSSSDARYSELGRDSEQLGLKLLRLKAKQSESRQTMEKGHDEINRLRAVLNNVETELERVVNEDIAEASTQATRQKQLYRAITHAEKALQDARGSIKSKQVVEEHERLLSEKGKLVNDVAAAAAATSQWELRVRRDLSAFQYLSNDLEEVLSSLHATSTDFATLVQSAGAEVQFKIANNQHLQLVSSSASSPSGNTASASAASGSPPAVRGAGGGTKPGSPISSPSSNNVIVNSGGSNNNNNPNNVTPVEEKMIVLHKSLLQLVREHNRNVLRRTQKINEVSALVANVFDDVLSVPDIASGALPLSETMPPGDRLVAKCHTAVKSDATGRLREQLLSKFEDHLRASVKEKKKR